MVNEDRFGRVISSGSSPAYMLA